MLFLTADGYIYLFNFDFVDIYCDAEVCVCIEHGQMGSSKEMILNLDIDLNIELQHHRQRHVNFQVQLTLTNFDQSNIEDVIWRKKIKTLLIGLVSLFNSILTFVGYLISKPSLMEKSWLLLTHSLGNKEL